MMITKSLVLAAVASLTLGAAPSWASGAPFSDTFTSDSSINPGWTLVELNPASSHTLDSTGLTLTTSGTGSDLWPYTNYGASLLLQSVSPAADFTVTLQMAYNPQNNFSGAGLVLTTQTGAFSTASAFQRFEYETNFTGNGFYVFNNGAGGPYTITPAGSPDTWIRLQKQGDVYTVTDSTDGANYSTLATITDPTAYTYVGLISDRLSQDEAQAIHAYLISRAQEDWQPDYMHPQRK